MYMYMYVDKYYITVYLTDHFWENGGHDFPLRVRKSEIQGLCKDHKRQTWAKVCVNGLCGTESENSSNQEWTASVGPVS